MQHLSEIVEEARKKGKKRLAVAYGSGRPHAGSRLMQAYKEGLVEPILFGDPKIIEQVCKEENIDCNISR